MAMSSIKNANWNVYIIVFSPLVLYWTVSGIHRFVTMHDTVPALMVVHLTASVLVMLLCIQNLLKTPNRLDVDRVAIHKNVGRLAILFSLIGVFCGTFYAWSEPRVELTLAIALSAVPLYPLHKHSHMQT
jgi:predicted ferric reductase